MRLVPLLRQIGGGFEAQAQFVQLGLGGVGRGVGQHAGRLLGFGKGDDVADGVLAAQEHHQTVEAEGQAAVGWCAGLQGVQQEAEFVLVLLGFHAQGVEDPGLQGLVVDTDAAAADFKAVEHQVVGP